MIKISYFLFQSFFLFCSSAPGTFFLALFHSSSLLSSLFIFQNTIGSPPPRQRKQKRKKPRALNHSSPSPWPLEATEAHFGGTSLGELFQPSTTKWRFVTTLCFRRGLEGSQQQQQQHINAKQQTDALGHKSKEDASRSSGEV